MIPLPPSINLEQKSHLFMPSLCSNRFRSTALSAGLPKTEKCLKRAKKPTETLATQAKINQENLIEGGF